MERNVLARFLSHVFLYPYMAVWLSGLNYLFVSSGIY